MVGKVLFGRLGSTSAGSRVYPLLLPQDATFPAVTYQQISRTQEHAYGVEAGVLSVRVQVDSWAESYAAARSLADEVAAALSRYNGTINGVTVRDIVLDNERELYEETGIRRVWQDYVIYIEA